MEEIKNDFEAKIQADNEPAQCPECLTKVTVGELVAFNGVCEACLETMNEENI